MATSWLRRLEKQSRPLSRLPRKTIHHGRFRPKVEALDERVLPAVTATFSAATGVLTVTGDELDNSLAVSRDAAGTLVVNGDGFIVPIQGGPAAAANTTLIQIFGMGGNDELIWSRSVNLPGALIDGGAGDDIITSGTGNDTLVGGAGNDIYRLDTDTAAGSDTIDESGGGIDTLDFSSTNTRAVSINLGNTAAQVINAGLTLTLSAGNTIENVIGGDLNDNLTGNGLNNVILGSAGNDTLVGAAGNDTFQWNPGDGNDIVDGITGDGLGGSDRLVFNGSDVAERFAISAVGNGGRVTRDVDNVILDLVGVETVDVNALGGADIITVGDLSATAVTAVNLDVGTAGDGAADAVIVTGTAGNDQIDVSTAGLRVIGLHAPVSLTNVEPIDSLTINAGGGDDNVVASLIPAGSFKLTENGEAGNDTLTGSRGNDTLVGGDGDDFVEGFRGNDLALMGAGNDTFDWEQGDGSDTVEGQGGHDTMLFNGSNEVEAFDISANGNRVRFLRTLANAANVTMDLNGVEQVDLSARGGADTIVVNDLSATDLTTLNIDLDSAAGTGFGDNASDSVIVNGTNGADAIQIASFELRIAIGGLFPFVNITGEDGLDTLTVNTLGGNDLVDAANLAATNASQLIKLTENGGAGNDTLIGSQGADTFVWNPGDGSDTIEGGDNPDTLIFNGSDLPEEFDLSANGSRVRLTRDVGGVTMDLNGVDAITLNPVGGADTVTVNDLTGTARTQITLNLAGTVGGATGDGQADSVIFNGTNGADSIPVAGNGGVTLVNGDGSLPYAMLIRAVEATDALRINGNGGNDTVNATNLSAGVIGLTVIGGVGNDTIVGSQGDDTFVWNPGDGSDTLDGQAGNDKLTFNGSDQGETFVISRNGTGVRLFRDAGTVTMDLNAVEGIELNALGGADTVSVNDLTGTGLVKVQLNLAGSAGGGDGQPDQIIVNGTNGDDQIRLAAFGSTILVDGLSPAVRITGSDGPTDHLTVNTLGGNDTVDSTGLPANLIGLTVNLGDGQVAPRVTGVVVNGGAAQRSLVTRIQVTFDQHVTLPANPADAFRLVRQSDGAAVLVGAAVDDSGAGTVVTLTFIGGAVEGASLADGRYTLTVLAGQGGSVNGALDGDGDGQAGGNFVVSGDPTSNKLFRLFGDVNGDGAVNGLDLASFRAAFGTITSPADSPFDVNGDGAVNGLDLTEFRAHFGATI